VERRVREARGETGPPAKSWARATYLSDVSKLNAFTSLPLFFPLLSSFTTTALAPIFPLPQRCFSRLPPENSSLNRTRRCQRRSTRLVPLPLSSLSCACACARACFPRCVPDATGAPRPSVACGACAACAACQASAPRLSASARAPARQPAPCRRSLHPPRAGALLSLNTRCPRCAPLPALLACAAAVASRCAAACLLAPRLAAQPALQPAVLRAAASVRASRVPRERSRRAAWRRAREKARCGAVLSKSMAARQSTCRASAGTGAAQCRAGRSCGAGGPVHVVRVAALAHDAKHAVQDLVRRDRHVSARLPARVVVSSCLRVFLRLCGPHVDFVAR
jgi:hypothetical protein